MPKNYYIILGISSDSSQEDIRAAFRRLAKEFHPDYFGDNHSPFLVIQEAYSVLSDPERRKTYDISLQENRKTRDNDVRAEPLKEDFREDIESLIPKRGPVDRNQVSLKRSFVEQWPYFDDVFDYIFGHFLGSNPKGERLENLTVVINLTPEQSFRGGQVRLYVPAKMQCPGCHGRGGIGSYECWRCGGAGYLTAEYPIMISYPPGIPDNHSVQLSLDRYGIHNRNLTVNFRISDMV